MVFIDVPFVVSVNRCSPNPCKNNGKCVANGYGYKCYCKPGYSGSKCES